MEQLINKMSLSPKKKLVYFPFLTYGHVNVCAAIGNKLLDLYSDQVEVIFLQNEKYAPKVKELCPRATIVTYVHPFDEEEDQAGIKGLSIMDIKFQEFGKIWQIQNSKDRLNAMVLIFQQKLDSLKVIYERVTPILKQIKPDLLIYDQLMTSPIGQDLDCPWSLIMSSAPSYFGHWQIPPPVSGLPSEFTEANVKLWQKFIDDTYKNKHLKPILDELNEWLKEKKCPNLDGYYAFYTPSPYLNIYNYPKELDYQNTLVRLPGNWVSLESAIENTVTEKYEVPERFNQLPGKLIYFSLGSMASSYTPLMNILLEKLREIPHKFIISLGRLLPMEVLHGNLAGERFLDQQKVLNTVDLMITHGGNNSLTECFHYGVPVIVFPLFGDQLCNAQRVVEKGFGLKFDPFTVTSEQLGEAIDTLLQDEQLKHKLIKASQRIKKDNGLTGAAKAVAELMRCQL